MIKAFEENTGAKVPYKVVDRRAGDTVAVWAATELAEKELGWKSKYSVADMCRDQWRWAQKYPQVPDAQWSALQHAAMYLCTGLSNHTSQKAGSKGSCVEQHSVISLPGASRLQSSKE